MLVIPALTREKPVDQERKYYGLGEAVARLFLPVHMSSTYIRTCGDRGIVWHVSPWISLLGGNYPLPYPPTGSLLWVWQAFQHLLWVLCRVINTVVVVVCVMPEVSVFLWKNCYFPPCDGKIRVKINFCGMSLTVHHCLGGDSAF